MAMILAKFSSGFFLLAMILVLALFPGVVNGISGLFRLVLSALIGYV